MLDCECRVDKKGYCASMASTRGQRPALPFTDPPGILNSQRNSQLQDPEPRIEGLQMNVYRCSKQKSKSKSVGPVSIFWGSAPGWVSAYLDMLYADVPFTCELRFSSPASL